MIELVVLGVLAFCAFVVFGALFAAASMVGWILVLPFRMLGLLFRGVGLLVGLPLLLIALTVGGLVLGLGAVLAFVPLLPIALLAAAVVWLVRRAARRPAHV